MLQILHKHLTPQRLSFLLNDWGYCDSMMVSALQP